jgi:hypothetical protein
MEELKVLNHLISELKERERSLLQSLGDGAATDYAAYREVCGNIRGLLFAQSLIADLARKLEKLNNE